MTDILDVLEDEEFEPDAITLDDGESVVEAHDETLEVDDEVLGEELVVQDNQLSESKARELTDAIKSAATATWILIAQAHEGKAYLALGYSTWAEYIKTEFDLSTQRSYQLLDLSKAVKEIESVAPDGTKVKLTEAQARDIKRELPEITEKIKEQTAGKSPEEAEEDIDEIIREARADKKAEDDAIELKEKSVQDAREEGRREGIEAAADAMLEADKPEGMGDDADGDLIELEVGSDPGASLSPVDRRDVQNFFYTMQAVSSLPEPDQMLRIIPAEHRKDLANQIMVAAEWFNRLQTLHESMEDDDED